MSSLGIFIPARLNSTRLKEKMLIEIDGKPLIRNVYDKVKSFGYDTYVLTDSKKILSVIPENCIMSGEHENGTARIASIVDKFNYTNYINVQGDMLDIDNQLVEKIAIELINKDIVTAYTKNKTSVRIIHDNNTAHWFTRKDIGYGDYHLGVYGYKTDALSWYSNKKRTEPEIIEDLEQLRFFGNYEISVVEHNYNGREINTKEDL